MGTTEPIRMRLRGPAPDGCNGREFIFGSENASGRSPRTYPPQSQSGDCEWNPRENKMHFRIILATSAAIVMSASAVQAAQVAALSGDNTISIIDTASKSVTKTWKIHGIPGKVLGNDVR